MTASCTVRSPGLDLDGACLGVFSVASAALTTLGSGRLALPSTLDIGTALAALACLEAVPSSIALTDRDRVTLAGFALTWLALDGRLAAIGLTVAGLAGLGRSSRIPSALAGLWLAIATHVLWAPLAFRFVGRWVIAAEMPLIGAAAHWAMADVEMVGARIQAGSGWYIYVLEGCSAFAGLSGATLVWLATHHLIGLPATRRDGAGLVLGLCGVLVLNVARILLMLPSAAAYAWWHTGPGSTVILLADAALGAVPAMVTAGRR